ncbi:MAG: response regulator [Burkholderiales bacterium]
MSSQAAPRVVIVDDDEAVRDALSMLLRAEGFAVETAPSAEAFLARSAQQPACLVLDVRMPGMSGLELQEKLAERTFDVPIVFLTGHGDVPMAVRAIKRGAFDFIEKPIDDARLVAAVREAIAYSSRAAPAAGTTRAPPGLDTLTRREREVLDLILAGRQTRAIADALFVTVKTVEFHRGRIYAKLGVASMAELFKLCFGPQPGDRVS